MIRKIPDRENIKLLYSDEKKEMVSLSSRNIVCKWKLIENDEGLFHNSEEVKSVDFSYNKEEFLPVYISKYSSNSFFLSEHFTGCNWIIEWDSFEVEEGYQIPEKDGAETTSILHLEKNNLFVAGGGYSSLYFIDPRKNIITKALSKNHDYIDNLYFDEKSSLFIHSDIDQDNSFCLCKLDFNNLKIVTLDRFHGGSSNHFDGITFLPKIGKFVCVSKWGNEHKITLMNLKNEKVNILQEKKIKLSATSRYKDIRKCNVHVIDERLFVCGGNKILIFSLFDIDNVEKIELGVFINDSVLVNKNRQICLGTNKGLVFWNKK